LERIGKGAAHRATPLADSPTSYPKSTESKKARPLNSKMANIDINKGIIQDVNLITSIYDKKISSIVGWINNDKLLYVNKEKTLDYLSISAPIAEARDNQEFISAAKVQQNFEITKDLAKKHCHRRVT